MKAVPSTEVRGLCVGCETVWVWLLSRMPRARARCPDCATGLQDERDWPRIAKRATAKGEKPLP